MPHTAIEGLFPIPLLRSRGVFGPTLIADLIASIREAHTNGVGASVDIG